MLRKRAIAAALMVIGASLIWTAGALAAPKELTVRVEGKEKTLFEGPILTEGRGIRASSDTQSRHCDGTNLGAFREPVPTPTAASADAMEMIGQTFDGIWADSFDDYFITRWGPDEQDIDAEVFWGVLVNGVFTPVGGCQFGGRAGDEALWAYNAFNGRPFLWLAAASDPTAAPDSPLPTAYVEVGEPLALVVGSYDGEGGEPQPAEGVTIGPVQTDLGTGFQTVETGDASAVSTAADGSAEVTFSTPGWHRLKAQEEIGFIRSNRLDVCVEPVGGGGCGPLPGDAALRVPDRYKPPVPPPAGETPSNLVSLGSAVVDRRNGVARLNVSVPGAGVLTMSGSQVLRESRSMSRAGLVLLTIKPTAKVRKALRKKGKVRVGIGVSFTPAGGTTGSKQRSVTLRMNPARR